MKIIFRTNGGQDIGMGHVTRCLSLAHGLLEYNKNLDITFIANSEMVNTLNHFHCIKSEEYSSSDINLIKSLKPQIIILDTYLASSEYIALLHQICFLVVIDDNNDLYKSTSCDVILNGNIYANDLDYRKSAPSAHHLLGSEYLIMKSEYWGYTTKIKSDFSKRAIESQNKILITTGGADPHHLMLQFIDILKETEFQKYLIIGPCFDEKEIGLIQNRINHTFHCIYKPESLKSWIEQASTIISSAGSTTYEILLLHKIPILFSYAINQNKILEYCHAKGALSLGMYPDLSLTQIIPYITKISQNISVYKSTLAPLYKKIDGLGVLRSVRSIFSLYNQ